MMLYHNPTNIFMSKYAKKEISWYPTLVRVKRRKGKVIQGCDIYISKECTGGGWNLPKSKWYNSHFANEPDDYIKWMSEQQLDNDVYQLVGQTLGCWCEFAQANTCHGQVLIQKTKQFIDNYFIKYRKESRDLSNIFMSTSSKLKMQIIPYRRIKLKTKHPSNPSNTSNKKYNLKINPHNTHNTHNTHNLLKPYNDPTKKIVRWNYNTQQWDTFGDIQLIDNRLTDDAEVHPNTWNKSIDSLHTVKKNTSLTNNGRIDLTEMIIQSHNNNLQQEQNNSTHKENITTHTNPDLTESILVINHIPPITQSAISDLYRNKIKRHIKRHIVETIHL